MLLLCLQKCIKIYKPIANRTSMRFEVKVRFEGVLQSTRCSLALAESLININTLRLSCWASEMLHNRLLLQEKRWAGSREVSEGSRGNYSKIRKCTMSGVELVTPLIVCRSQTHRQTDSSFTRAATFANTVVCQIRFKWVNFMLDCYSRASGSDMLLDLHHTDGWSNKHTYYINNYDAYLPDNTKPVHSFRQNKWCLKPWTE